MVIFVTLIILILYFSVALVLSSKIDNSIRYKISPNISNKELSRLALYTLFWVFFFRKIDKIIKNE